MYIKFGSLQIKLLIPIIFPIFLQIRNYIRENTDYATFIFKGFNNFLSLTLFGFFYLITKFTSKSSKDVNESKNIDKKQELNNINDNNEEEKNPSLKDFHRKKEIETIKLKTSKTPKIKQFLFALLISGLQFTPMLSKNIWKTKNKGEFKFNLQTLIQLIYLIVFSKCFLGFSIYSHQIFSIIIILICLIIFFTESLIYHNIRFTYMFLINLKIIFEQFFYCLSDVLGKKYLITYMDSFYLFLFKIGSLGFIPIVIYGIITLCLNVDARHLFFRLFTKNNLCLYFLDLFFSFLYQLSLVNYLLFNPMSLYYL